LNSVHNATLFASFLENVLSLSDCVKIAEKPRLFPMAANGAGSLLSPFPHRRPDARLLLSPESRTFKIASAKHLSRKYFWIFSFSLPFLKPSRLVAFLLFLH